MKARQRKKWPWYECTHLQMKSQYFTYCKQDCRECSQIECKKHTVSKFRKHCENLGKKVGRRFSIERLFGFVMR